MTTPYPHVARKRFGQHFLHDRVLIHHLIDLLDLQPSDQVVEIGPGKGALTHSLLAALPHLHAIEIDRDLAAQLKKHHNLSLHIQDVLQFDFSTLPSPLRVIGNLPYNISTPLLLQFQRHSAHLQDVHIMVQKEVGDRLAATVGHKDYGRLSVHMQYHFDITVLVDVPPTAFTPPPKVSSCFVRLLPKRAPEPLALDFPLVTRLIARAFQQRRKTLRNSLKDVVAEEIWSQLGLSAQSRAEDLSVADYVRLGNTLASLPANLTLDQER